jgi:membrane protease YdiL (CAAX protease family)
VSWVYLTDTQKTGGQQYKAVPNSDSTTDQMHPYVREYLRRLRLLTWNGTEQRPRALLRVSVFLSLYTIGFVSIPVLIAPAGTGLPRAAGLRLVLVLWTGGLVFGAAKFLDRRPVHTFGLTIDSQWRMDGLAGILIGLTIPTGATLIGLIVGWITMVETGTVPTVAFLRDICLAIIVTGCIAVTEEFVFRGYVLTNAIEGLDLRWVSPSMTIASAWGICALLFAFTHEAPTLGDGLNVLAAGFLLGLAYLLTGQLALPIGIHAGYNFASVYIFSTAHDPSVAVVPLTVHGPAWLAGQTGVVYTGLQLPAVLTMLAYVWWRSGTVDVSPAIKAKLAES